MIALGAAVLALSVRRPLMAAMGLLLLPIAAVALPSLAVVLSTYAGCQINEDGIGDCVLWARKGRVRRAPIASSTRYDTVPYSFALALMVGTIGFVFFRPKETR